MKSFFRHLEISQGQKRWRRTQYLVNEFWSRWRVEFLQNLQARQKWLKSERNLVKGDIVLLKEDNPLRNSWRLGFVVEAYEDNDGLVRKVKDNLCCPLSTVLEEFSHLSKINYVLNQRQYHSQVTKLNFNAVPNRRQNYNS